LSEWYNNQQKPSDSFRKLLQERMAKANTRRELTDEEIKRLTVLEVIAIMPRIFY